MRRLWTALAYSLPTLLLTGGVAAAAADSTTFNPGLRLQQWITNNVTVLFFPILAIFAIYYLVKREFTKFLSFTVFAALAALLVFGGQYFKDAAVSFARFLIGQ